ncbi:MAG: ATP-binding cassette domain-containing protein, partial [Pseudomonadota bacterium]
KAIATGTATIDPATNQIAARIRSFDSVRDFVIGPLFLAVLELPFTLAMLAAIWFVAGSIVAVPVAMALAYFVVILIYRRRLQLAVHAAAKESAQKQQLGLQTLSNLAALRQGGMSERQFERMRAQSGDAAFAGFRSGTIAAEVETIAQVLQSMAMVGVVYMGVGAVMAGTLSIGGLIATTLLVGRVLAPLATACASLPRLEQLRRSIRQIDKLMDAKRESDPHTQSRALHRPSGALTFSKVGLRYARDADPVFSNLSLAVEPGEVVAIMGANGAGKSSLLKLANRLSMQQAGSVRLDGVDLRQIDPVDLRRNMAYVPESNTLFQGTLADNLRFADPLASDDALWDALEKVDAADEVRALPLRLDTPVGGALEAGLPPGLSYQIGLARAYLVDHPVFLIDELPPFLLNGPGGAAFREFLMDARGHRTVLFVTRRSDYMRLADKVVILDPERRPVIGTPDDVSARRAA